MIRNYYKYFVKLFLAFGLLASACIAQAQNSIQHTELTSLLRQLDLMQNIVAQAANQPNDPHARYYFDYQRLDEDLTRVRSGIEHYLTPQRAQPRDPVEFYGDYTQQNKRNGQ